MAGRIIVVVVPELGNGHPGEGTLVSLQQIEIRVNVQIDAVVGLHQAGLVMMIHLHPPLARWAMQIEVQYLIARVCWIVDDSRPSVIIGTGLVVEAGIAAIRVLSEIVSVPQTGRWLQRPHQY